MRIVRRLYFTMLELLVVISILSLIGGTIGINIAKSVREQYFRTEVSQVVDQLRLAQDLMLIFHTDVFVKFSHKSGTDSFRCELEFPVAKPKMSESWLNELQRKRKNLTYTRSITFQTIDGSDDYGEMDELVIAFMSGGSKMSKGFLRLSTSRDPKSLGALERFITLPGFPSPIFDSAIYTYDKQQTEKDEVFNKSLTQQTIEEIRAQELQESL
jgi:hypothetical protein